MKYAHLHAFPFPLDNLLLVHHSRIMIQRFAFLLLVASVALVGTVVPVDAAKLAKRETNAQRFARGLGPLPPAKRCYTNSAWSLSLSLIDSSF